MSIDLNWETFTSGPDGEELAARIRDFIHVKFQAVKLPRFIKSVTVHDFEFGSIAPQLELKDITDPLPDFYEENEEYEDDEDGEAQEGLNEDGGGYDDGTYGGGGGGSGMPGRRRQQEMQRLQANQARPRAVHHHHPQQRHLNDSPHGHVHPGPPSRLQTGSPFRGAQAAAAAAAGGDMTSPFLGVSTPGILGGASNLHYFQSHLGTGWSGSQTPLAAVAGAHMGGGGGGGHQHHGDFVGPSSAASSPGLYPSHYPVDGPAGGGGFHSAGAGPSTPSSFHSRNPSQSSISVGDLNPALEALTPGNLAPQQQQQPSQTLREKSSVSTLAPTSVNTSRPPTRDPSNLVAAAGETGFAIEEEEQGGARYGKHADGTRQQQQEEQEQESQERKQRYREPRPDDMQAVFRIRYAGDIKLRLTAEILLDYPMPSFVGIPVQLSVTGLTFDGVGVLAHIRKRVHFCFLSPEDAFMAVGLSDGREEEEEAEEEGGGGGEDGQRQGHQHNGHGGHQRHAEGGQGPAGGPGNKRFGGLLQEIRVESEIGLREGGKQSLKNVGKVERFVLEQVRKIFEDEFVYPSFWTFLV